MNIYPNYLRKQNKSGGAKKGGARQKLAASGTRQYRLYKDLPVEACAESRERHTAKQRQNQRQTRQKESQTAGKRINQAQQETRGYFTSQRRQRLI